MSGGVTRSPRLHFGTGRVYSEEEKILMEGDSIKGIGGWLLVYVVSSIPVILFYSAGLSGWFFDYPVLHMAVIFLALASPLLLIPLKSPKAPRWNIAVLWTAFILITLRIVYGVLFQRMIEGGPRSNSEELLAALPILLGIVIFSLGWAVVWTKYLKESLRVRNTFS